jgi:HemY protein
MRTVLWLLSLFVIAIIAAATLGTNDGLASLYWRGWRIDLSLNLFLLLLAASCVALVAAMRGAVLLFDLPQRALAWRLALRERGAQQALREALAFYFGGRFARAQKSAQRALAMQRDTPQFERDRQFAVLAHVLAAGSAHRLQDRGARDAAMHAAFELTPNQIGAGPAEEGARMLAAEWALDDRDAERALQWLGELPVGVARRVHALRLKLQASRLARQPQEALKTARLLAKHQAFAKAAAEGLLRTLAIESLDSARDADQLRRTWQQFEGADRRDAFVAARAALRVAELGAADEARDWLRPFWERLGDLADDERGAVAQALSDCTAGIGADWLARLEAAAAAFPRDGAIALAVGSALAERQLWGKARQMLELAAQDTALRVRWRRAAWLRLAQIARDQGQEQRAAQAYESAACLGD